MSTGTLLTVLSNIPWGQVIENAPKVADGAAKLWSRLRKPQAAADDAPRPADGAPLSDVALLQSRVRDLELSVGALHEQMEASTELIKALAEQNAQLVQRAELNRVRLLRVTVAGACIAAALVALAFVLLKP
ncbi:MAG TPA: hypothetical protein PLX20_08295 [Rhodocyclaceae bacterium]|nr:hypothetical protein [Rhodocyclaceae bacterium]HNC61898.1 hypothetical protein [Rhodocyclaceae bacterium]HNH13117.1 hypothetical protein [Rhodocyclaceae bacterium]